MDNNSIIDKLPKMLSGENLKEKLTILPKYNDSVRNENQARRLIELNNLYNIYLPSGMSTEIYSKLYLAMIRSLQKKNTKLAIMQKNENHKIILQDYYNGTIGGSDSFTIIGTSGIGKSSAISRAINLITENRIIEVEEPYTKIIPCIICQTPFDCSVKGLLLEVLRKVDEAIDSNYYNIAIKARATTDMLIGSVSQVALNHIGILILDEIQNVVSHRNGNNLVGCLTQMINHSGISIAMIGTPESELFFEKVNYLARRALGLKYTNCSYSQYFKDFCKIVFSYQYVKERTEITDSIIEWIYEHSSGTLALVVSLIHDAQEIAILNGKEILNMETLNEAYSQRMSMMYDFIQPSLVKNSQTSKKKKEKKIIEKVSMKNEIINIPVNKGDCEEFSIVVLATEARKNGLDIVELLKGKISIVEVAI